MRRLLYSAIASLDGYVADESGRFDWAAPNEAVHAFVVPRSGTPLDSSHDAGIIVEHARAHLAGFKVPRSVSWMSELPKTGSGKSLKRELRAPYWSVAGRMA